MNKKNTKKISDQVLKTIKTKKITPISRWEFVVKNGFFWSLLIMCILVLIIAVSLSIFGVLENTISPYFWLFTTVIFLLLAYLFLLKTRGSYRFNFFQKILPLLVIGLLVGFFFFRIGVASRLDSRLANRFSYYRHLTPLKFENWSQPQDGLLSGQITKYNNINDFYLTDFTGKTWHIAGENILVRGRVKINLGETIKILGKQTGTSTFFASEIRPWSGRNQSG